MAKVYLCDACARGDHGHCELGHAAPNGEYGGSICRCPCRGDAKWNIPKFNGNELQDILRGMRDHQKATDEWVKNNPPLNLGGGQIKLKKP